jgi:hypothetical protein
MSIRTSCCERGRTRRFVFILVVIGLPSPTRNCGARLACEGEADIERMVT